MQKYFSSENITGEKLLKNIVFTVGKRSDAMTDFDDRGGFAKDNVLGMTINLVDKKERDTESFNISKLFKKEIANVLPAFAEVRITEVSEGPPSGAPIEVRILGDNLGDLENAVKILSEQIEQIPGTKNIRDSIAEKTIQYSWEFDPELLAKFGLSIAQVSETLRAGVHGATVLQIFEGDDEIDVEMRFDFAGDRNWDDPESLEILFQIPIKTPSGNFIKLNQVATGRLTSEISEINHFNGARIVFVRADLEKGIPVSEISPKVEKLWSNSANETLEKVDLSLGGEDEDSRRLVSEMGASMIFALFLILIALVLQFDSFSRSVVILSLIPFSLTGVFLGFFLTGLSISFPTMIGIVALAGIIVNDAIVLVDRINVNTEMHQCKLTAMVNAGCERLQPIFLTSLTTVLGLLPLVISDPVWGALGLAIVFGMTFSTVLTLLLVPCLLVVFDSTKDFLKEL